MGGGGFPELARICSRSKPDGVAKDTQWPEAGKRAYPQKEA